MRRHRSAVGAGLLLALAAACDGSPAEPGTPALQIRDIVLTDAAGAVVAYSHGDHWHGTVRVPAGGTLALRAAFTDAEDGHDEPASRFTLEAHPDYTLRVTAADPTVAAWAGDRVALTVRGLRAGSARTDFVVARGGTTVYDAPRVLVVVE